MNLLYTCVVQEEDTELPHITQDMEQVIHRAYRAR